ncbi:hypothetical protein FTO68_10485 [Methanocalculus taiwanensis]|uniref:Uncharacterized protein n=1 Tax=Methanocalculus taiwanensis TaxID=106207 RepID=A0ABD4TQ41_9EURY|nr:hypothetical protein [Methanocalculus taiwanensis]MCQ1539405.1 hypothetical protein [Methanocalculus taiwanensis]
MYSRITSSDNEKGFLKPVGPYRYHSSGNSVSSMKSSGTFGLIGNFTIAPLIQCPVPETREEMPQPSKDDDFRMLMQRHKKTLELLAE